MYYTTETLALRSLFSSYAGSGQVLLGQHVRPYKFGTELPAMQSRWGVQPAFVEFSYMASSGTYGDLTLHNTMKSTMQAHANAGGIVGISFHFPNFVTGQNSYDRDRVDTSAVDNLLASASSSSAKTDWYTYLDNIAAYLNGLTDTGGKKIPVAIRLFHEANGWQNHLINDGPNGAAQIETRTITALSGSGTVLTATLAARPSPANLNFALTAGSYIQITGASAGYNGSYQVQTCTPTADTVGATATLTLIKSNGATVTAGAAAVPGSIYLCNGFWWAGRDRSTNLMKLFNETVRYLRHIKGVRNALFYTTPYPLDSFGAHWTATETNVDSIGRTFAYENWYPGDGNCDLFGMDYYHFKSTPVADSGSDVTLQASVARLREVGANKPFAMGEVAALSNGLGTSQDGFWTLMLNGLLGFRMAGFLLWDESYFPQSTDPAGPSFSNMLNSSQCVTLNKLNRGW